MSGDFTSFEDDEDGAASAAPRTVQPSKATDRQGRTIKVVAPAHDPGHRNPPLAALNKAYRAEDDAERRKRASVVERATNAIRGAFGNGARRTQKPLRPVS